MNQDNCLWFSTSIPRGHNHNLAYHGEMLRYHVAFHLPKGADQMVVAEALDFPGAVSQGFDLPDARLMIASAMEDLAQSLLEEGHPLPLPDPNASAPDADLAELLPLTILAGAHQR
ncbi:MAG TPA: type II toxin-antitoxin system HicB family antitoxin [Paludibaculum sp.]|jgi:predicted RNase H-like HicB family nuclease